MIPVSQGAISFTLENTALNHILLHRAVMSFITSVQMFIFRLMSTRLQDTILQWTLPHLIHMHLKFNTPNSILMTPPWLSVICIPRTKEGILQNSPKNNSLKWLTPLVVYTSHLLVWLLLPPFTNHFAALIKSLECSKSGTPVSKTDESQLLQCCRNFQCPCLCIQCPKLGAHPTFPYPLTLITFWVFYSGDRPEKMAVSLTNPTLSSLNLLASSPS